MRRPSPLVQMTMALVALCGTLVLLGALFVGAVPDRDAQAKQLRRTVTEALAVQIAEALARDDPATLQQSMAAIVERTAGLRSVGVRRTDGTLVLQTAGHAEGWRLDDDEHRSRAGQLSVPLRASSGPWGRFEAVFSEDESNPLLALLKEPLVRLLLFVGGAGWLVFGLYMRRALQHLDPASVVPERVQGAFDAMAEGVAVLDSRGRVMLTNKAMRAMHPAFDGLRTGSALSALDWLARSLPEEVSAHPWMRAIAERTANANTLVEAGDANDRRQLVLNAAPICDPGGAVRGCIVTLTDTSALHRANESLRSAMSELGAAKAEVERQNRELETLASRDALTGALNRRAFHAAVEPLLARSRETGAPIACLMFDIDHFKAVNDTHGHGVGDRVIQELARKLHESTRGGDLVCRWGGEEFCVVIAGLGAQSARDFAERARQRIERECGPGVREVPGLRITASVGVDVMTHGFDAIDESIERADDALYRSKRDGRNRVTVHGGAGRTGTPRVHLDQEVGCLNAAGLAAQMEAIRQAARAEGREIGCLAFEIDHAAALADAHGAEALRLALRELYGIVRDTLPAAAAIGRPHPRRLVAIVPGLGLADCEFLGGQVRTRAQSSLAECLEGAESGSVTVSCGVDALPVTAPGVATLADRAEQALQRARRGGGNAVQVFHAASPGAAADAVLRVAGEGEPR